MHRGGAAKGIAHYNYQHGRRSKVLKGVMLEDYEGALQSRETLHNLADEIALTDSMTNRLVERIGGGDSLGIMKRLRTEWSGFSAAQRRGDTDDAAQHLDTVGSLITRGASLTDQIEEVSRLVDRRRKLADSHHRQLVSAEQTLNRDQVMALVGALVSAVNRNVSSEAERAAVQEDINAAIGRGRA